MSIFIPQNQTERLLVEAVIEHACLRKPHRTMAEGYTAQIVKKRVVPGEEGSSPLLWHPQGRYEAVLQVTGPKRDMEGTLLPDQESESEEGIPDLMDGTTVPIFFWLSIHEGIPGHFHGEVEIWWHLPPNDWLHTPHGMTDAYPSMPGTFLWKPTGWTY